MDSVFDFKTEYLSWLRDNTEALALSSGTVRLTAPFLDSDNDFIEIYITRDGDRLFLSDAGETISNLELSNFRMSEKRRVILNSFVAANGVRLTANNEIVTECPISSFGQKANSLMQCMIKVSDMLMLSEPNVRTLFTEDVQKFFDDNNVIYTPNVSFVGKSTFYANYDFVIPRTRMHPERFIAPINYPKDNIIKTTIFTWEDVKASRQQDCVLYAILNDTDKKISPSSFSALAEYGVKCIPWSKRFEALPELSA